MRHLGLILVLVLLYRSGHSQTLLTGYEYWYNSDYAGKQSVSFAPVVQHQLNTDVDVNALPEGLNVLNIRYLDDNKLFSSTLSKVFYKNSETFTSNKQLVSYEYWFNNDYASKVVVPISPTLQHSLVTAIDVNAVPEGINILHIRYLDEDGVYSVYLNHAFYKNTESVISNKELIEYEYWYNNDYASKQVVTISPASQISIVTNLDISGLADGLNVLNIRFKDEAGVFSSTLSKAFYKKADQITNHKIVAYQYWFDDDFANSVEVLLPAPVQQLTLNDNLDLTQLPKGIHLLNIQLKDSVGHWSLVFTDSIEKLSLPIANFSFSENSTCDSTIFTFTDESIDGDQYLWDFGDGYTDSIANPIHTYNSPGSYFVTLTVTDSITLDDSSFQVMVNVGGNTTNSISIQSCDSYLVPSGSYSVTGSGVFYDTIPNQWGCDSLLTLNVTINNATSSTDLISACGSLTWIDGNTYTTDNNTATFTIVGGAVNGCDSIVTLDLTINSVDISVIQNGPELDAVASGAQYQWLDCDDGYIPLSGETGQSFSATSNGNYAVVVTENGCTDTSACYLVYDIGISGLSPEKSAIIYPNPTQGLVTIDLGKEREIVHLVLEDLSGKIIERNVLYSAELINFSLNVPDGIYIIRLITVNEEQIFRVIKN